MELVSHTIGVKSRSKSQILVMPVGDIQWAGMPQEIALGMLKRHIKWGVEQGAYFIGMGDYIDTFSPSNRARLTSAGLYDTAMKVTDKMTKDLVDEIYDEALAPSKGRWLGLLEGHHFNEFRDGTTTDQYLSQKLDAKFLGTSAYVRLSFHNGTKRGATLIWCHHGVGGGGTMGGSLNKLENLAKSWEADIYLLGHDTKKVGAPIDYVKPIFPNNGAPPRLVHRTRIIARTGGFLKGYIPGNKHGQVPRGNYVEQAMLNPVALGGVLVKITPAWLDTPEGSTVWHPDYKVEA
jgi:hypothetical protein